MMMVEKRVAVRSAVVGGRVVRDLYKNMLMCINAHRRGVISHGQRIEARHKRYNEQQ